METKSILTGLIGTILTGTGALTQTHEILQIISIVVSIIGAILTFLVMPLINWFINARRDGKITIDEIKEGVEIVKDGVEEVSKEIENNGKN